MISEIKSKYGALAHGDGKDKQYWLWSMSLFQPPFPKGGYVESWTPGWSRTSTAGHTEEPDGAEEMARDLSKLFRNPPAFNHIRDIEEQSRRGCLLPGSDCSGGFAASCLMLDILPTRSKAFRIVNADSVDGATAEPIQHPPVSSPRGAFDFTPLDDYRSVRPARPPLWQSSIWAVL